MFASHAAFMTAGSAGDPYANSVVFLLKAQAGNTFSDASSAAHSISKSGTVTASTSVAKFGGTSAYFDGSGGYLSSPDSNDWDFGTSDFTIEMWAYLSSVNTNKTMISTYANSTTGWSMQHNQYGGFSWTRGDSPSISEPSPFASANTWAHVAASRSGTSLRLFINGVQSGSTLTNSTDVSGSSSALIIGNFAIYLNQRFIGYLQDLRITKGISRYTANFTPPGTLV
jgi:hypothetical protein